MPVSARRVEHDVSEMDALLATMVPDQDTERMPRSTLVGDQVRLEQSFFADGEDLRLWPDATSQGRQAAQGKQVPFDIGVTRRTDPVIWGRPRRAVLPQGLERTAAWKDRVPRSVVSSRTLSR